MDVFKSHEFLGILYPVLDVKEGSQRNQGIFIILFFNAAGSHEFTMPKSTEGRKSTNLQTERRYAINQPMTADLKRTFSRPFRIDDLTAFISAHLKTERAEEVKDEFGIPQDEILDTGILSRALAAQFFRFVVSDKEDEAIPNEIPSFYETLLSGRSIDERNFAKPRYTGDAAWVKDSVRLHRLDCYQRIRHTWIIENAGSQTWNGRRLVLMNGDGIRPCLTPTEIPLPTLEPKQHTEIATDIDARGFEDDFPCRWQLQDANGNDCLPGMEGLFDFTVRVEFHAPPDAAAESDDGAAAQ